MGIQTLERKQGHEQQLRSQERDQARQSQQDLEVEASELKQLNARLVERLAGERSAGAELQEKVQVFSNENETLQDRLCSLSLQLAELAEANDELRAEFILRGSDRGI